MSRVVVVGLGIMGGAIARLLAKAGHSVSGVDPDGRARAVATAAGVKALETLGQLSSEPDTVICSLPGAAAARSVMAELASLPGGRLIIETSTLGLVDKLALRDQLQEVEHRLLDCPISGTGAQMQEGDVVFYASGDAEDVDRAADLLEPISRRVLNLGTFGNGTRMKLIANHLVAVHNVAAAEAVLLGMRAGFSMPTLLEAIAAGAGNSRMFELRGPAVADRCYQPAAMKLSVWEKDLALIDDFTRELDANTPLFRRVLPLYAEALERGLDDCDTAAVAEVLRAGTGEDDPTNEEEN